jgi:DASH complex subunit DAD3
MKAETCLVPQLLSCQTLHKITFLTCCQLNTTLQTLASGPITLEMADGLRLLEQKVASVYTLMKASVYSIVLQQGQMDESDLGQDEGSVDE